MRQAVWGLMLLFAGVVILAGVYYVAILSISFFSDTREEYRAVFLTNGQVYFGKLSSERSQYVVLQDIFYLQVSPLSGGESPDQGANLVKLGTELHGPADEMRINRDHILYIEDLRPDSRVVETIRQFKAGSP